jgi:Holliday junction DNA helicase RuvA
MIGRIAGILLECTPPQILVDCQGVGYEIDVPMSTFYNLPPAGQKIALFTHLAIREDAHQLYGFGTQVERSTFKQLIKVSGIGSKTALSVLSGMSVGDLANAVAAQDPGRIVKVPGIGKKTAERLLLELKGKIVGGDGSAAIVASRSDAHSDVQNALLALGYSDKEASAAVKLLPADVGVSDGIKQALKSLSKS